MMQAPARRKNNVKNSRRNALRTLRKRDSVGLLLLGRCKTGKTSLVSRWIKGAFDDEYIPSVEEFNQKSFYNNDMGQNVNICIIDMTGSWDFPAMLDLYIGKVDSVMFVYEVNDEKSISEMMLFYKRLKKIRGEQDDVKITVVGTKIDRLQHIDDDAKNENVDNFIKEIGGNDVKHTLTSSKLDLNVNEAFENAINDVIANLAPNADAIKRLGKLMAKNEKATLCSRCSII